MPDSNIGTQWMTTQEVAEYLRISVITVRRQLAAGLMRGSQGGPRGKHLIKREWADEWAENRGKVRRIS